MPAKVYLREFLEHLDDIVFILNYPSMTYEYISPAIRARGVTPQEVYANPNSLLNMFDQETIEAANKLLDTIADMGAQTFEYPITLPSGERRWYSNRMFMFNKPDADGSMLGGIIRDITEHKTTEAKLQRLMLEYEDLYNHAPNGYHSLDPDGRFIRINRTELDWLGYEADEVVGKLRFQDILSLESKAVFQQIFEGFKKKGWVRDIHIDIIRKDGSSLSCLVNATAIFDEKGKFVMSRSVMTDLSRVKQADEQLRLAQLETQAANEDLKRANQKLERLNFTKDILLKIISHDLRNPLETIQLISQLLNEKYDVIDSETVLQHLEYINEASRQASHIIDDLTGLIRLENDDNPINFVQTNLCAIIDEAIGTNAKKAEDKGIRLVFEASPNLVDWEVKVDPKWMVRALDNLIYNAIKFSNSNDLITVSCQLAAQTVTLSVTDNGVGIPASNMLHLFDKFAAPNRPGTNGETGTGLGLSIVKQILEMQRGEISAKSTEGIGSTFEIRLPLANQPTKK